MSFRLSSGGIETNEGGTAGPRAGRTIRPLRSVGHPGAPMPGAWLIVLGVLVITASIYGDLASRSPGGTGPRAGGDTDLRPFPAPPPAPSTNSTCGALFSNASINASVASVYAELAQLASGGTNGSGSGQNSTNSTNVSAYPPEPAAVALVGDWWQTVCGEPQFASLISQWGADNFSWSASVGPSHVQWTFGFSWLAGCSLPGYGDFSGCGYAAGWTGDLGSRTLSGPTATVTPPCSTGGCPTFPLNLTGPRSPGTGAKGGLWSWVSDLSPERWAIAAGLIGVGGIAAGLVVLRRVRKPSPEPPREPEGDSSDPSADDAEPLHDAF